MKKQLLLTAGTFVLAIAWVVVANANARFLNVRFTNSINPNGCQYPITLPPECTLLSPGTVCSTTSGGITHTYYQFSACVTPYYKP